MKSKTKNLWLVIIFIILYSFFVFYVRSTVENYSDIIVGTTFFFTLFIGFFILAKTTDISAINDQLTSTDGYFFVSISRDRACAAISKTKSAKLSAIITPKF